MERVQHVEVAVAIRKVGGVLYFQSNAGIHTARKSAPVNIYADHFTVESVRDCEYFRGASAPHYKYAIEAGAEALLDKVENHSDLPIKNFSHHEPRLRLWLSAALCSVITLAAGLSLATSLRPS